jgi:hypothetical protein
MFPLVVLMAVLSYTLAPAATVLALSDSLVMVMLFVGCVPLIGVHVPLYTAKSMMRTYPL